MATTLKKPLSRKISMRGWRRPFVVTLMENGEIHVREHGMRMTVLVGNVGALYARAVGAMVALTPHPLAKRALRRIS